MILTLAFGHRPFCIARCDDCRESFAPQGRDTIEAEKHALDYGFLPYVRDGHVQHICPGCQAAALERGLIYLVEV